MRIASVVLILAAIAANGQVADTRQHIFLTIADSKGHAPKAVATDALSVTYAGKPVEAELHPARGAMDFVIVLDLSGSNRDKVQFIKGYTRDIFRRVSQEGGRGWLVTFNTQIVRAVGPLDSKGLDAELAALQFRGDTALFDSLKAVCGRGQSSMTAPRRAVFLLSDGENDSGSASLDDAVGTCLRARTSVFVVGMLSTLATHPRLAVATLHALSETTGGAAKLLDRPADISKWLDDAMQSQYELSIPILPSDSPQPLKIESRDRQLRVSAPQLY